METIHLAARVSPEMKGALEKVAKQNHRTTSAELRRAIHLHLRDAMRHDERDGSR